MATTPASELSDGPVLSVINKRLRALRKKHNRILQMEEALCNGKALNKEQEETFRSKPSVIAAIDELEKLRQPLANAVTEEIEKVSIKGNSRVPEKEIDGISIIEDVLKVIYFGNMFDHVKWGNNEAMLKRAIHERACCLNYDCMPDDESMDVVDLLSEKDLDLISMVSELLVCRPVNSTLSHKHAVEKCIEHAKLWVAKSDQPIGPESDATYAGLRLKLDKIMSSLYFTTDPVFRVEEAVADYESYPVPVEETEGVVPVNATVQVDTPAVQYQEKKEEAYVSSQADESNEIHSSSAELHQFTLAGKQEEILSERPAEQEVEHEGDDVQNLKDANISDQQSAPRRSYQNHRGNRGGGGGGRRGYSNGRGGRGRGWSHQNDLNPHYDQSGNHYQKNYNYRGRGGRGGRGGGNYSHYTSGDQAGNVSAVS